MEGGLMKETDASDLRERSTQFSLRILRVSAALPDGPEGRMVRGQLLRSGTSPGAQYREACRARSPAEFISKMESAQQELDETDYWIELIERAELLPAARLEGLKSETNELIAIFAASVRTAKANR
jgi:four helix bundle protein